MSFKSNILTMRTGMAASPAQQKTAPKSTGAGSHLSNAVAAHKSGDHASAKKHALKAVNALHRMAPAVSAGPANVPA